jgi:DNA-directed RNA polymerase subunit RPC12/RpoP
MKEMDVDACDGCGHEFEEGETFMQVTCDATRTVSYLCDRCDREGRIQKLPPELAGTRHDN